MDESIMSRAIFAGVSIFVTLAIISGVIAYYTIAKNISNSIETSNVIGKKYNKTIEAYLEKDVLKGYEVKNLLNYFYENKAIDITISKIKYIGADGKIKSDNNLKNINNDETNYIDICYKLLPNEQFSMVKSGDVPTIYTITCLE